MPPIHETLRGGPGPSELHGAIITCVHGRRRSSLLALPPSANVACVAVASENQGVCGHAAASCQAFKSRRRGSQPLCNSTVASPSEVVTLLLRAVEHPSATTTALPMKRSFRPQWASGAYRVEQLFRRRTVFFHVQVARRRSHLIVHGERVRSKARIRCFPLCRSELMTEHD